MPDGSGAGGRSAAEAIHRLGEHVLDLCPGAEALLPGHISRYHHRDAVAGWRLTVELPTAGVRRFDLLVDRAFPHSLPVLVLLDAPPPLTWPHVEEDGRLCAWPEAIGVDRMDITEITTLLLGRACDLIEEAASGRLDGDFADEFISYWNRFLPLSALEVLSLCSPQPPTRPVQVAIAGSRLVVADDPGTLNSWLSHHIGSRDRTRPMNGLLAWLPCPMLPRDYPRQILDLRSLLRREAPGAEVLLESLAWSAPAQIPVVLGAVTSSGPCLAAVVIERGVPNQHPGARVRDPLRRGFRPKAAPPAVVKGRYLDQARAVAAKVIRVDHPWIHGRDVDTRAARLRGAKVVVLGCGSVGAPVAVKLAEAGVGNLVLVDPEVLTSPNIGRHPLGVEALGRFKATALAELIRHRFPHIASVEGKSSGWRAVADALSDVLEGDLIISAIGDWAAEGSLNDWHISSGRRTPVLYAWTEAHACAGHAVLVGAQGGCLRCGMRDDLKPRLRVTEWPGSSTVRREAACGAFFQPYGPVELSYVTSLAAELALDVILSGSNVSTHRIWAARRTVLDAAGGRWTNEWITTAPHREQGGLLQELEWPAGLCPACGAVSKS